MVSILTQVLMGKFGIRALAPLLKGRRYVATTVMKSGVLFPRETEEGRFFIPSTILTHPLIAHSRPTAYY